MVHMRMVRERRRRVHPIGSLPRYTLAAYGNKL